MTAPTHLGALIGRHWRQAAACADVDPETFYPLDLHPTGPAVMVARQVCAECPVRTACLVDVMAGEDPARRWGVTAGLTPDERAAVFAGRRISPAWAAAVAA